MSIRRTAAFLLAAGALVAACASDEESPAGAVTPGTSATQPTQTPTSDTATAAATDASADTDGPAEADPSATEPPASDPAATTDPATACSLGARSEDDGDVTLTVWHFTGGRTKELLEQSIATFEADHPGVDIELVTQTGADSSLTAWQLADPSIRPDLMLLSEDYTGAMIESGGTLPFTGCLTGDEQGTLIPAVEATYTIDGELLAAPFYASTPLLYFDAVSFRAAGLDISDPPATLDELRAASQALVDSGATPTGLVMEVELLSGGSWYVEQFMAKEGLPGLDADNGRSGDPTTVLWEHPSVIGNLEFLQTMIDDGLAIVIEDASGFDDLLLVADVESTERGAMVIQTSGSLTELIAADESELGAGVELAVGPMPGPGPGSLVGGTVWWMAEGREAATTRAAWTFVDYLASSPVQAAISAGTGLVPVRPEALDEPVLAERIAQYPQYAVGPAQLMATGTEPGNLLPIAIRRPEIRRLLVGTVNSVLVNGIDPTTAITDAVERANDML